MIELWRIVTLYVIIGKREYAAPATGRAPLALASAPPVQFASEQGQMEEQGRRRHHRRQPPRPPRLPHREPLRGRPRPGGLGSQKPARRPRQPAGELRHLRNGEAWLLGANVSPLPTASTHINPDPIRTRTRKLLKHRQELNRLIGATEQKGYTLVPLDLHCKRGKAKLAVGLAKGKKKFDNRLTER